MNRQELWDRMKRYGMTHSNLKSPPPDVDLKTVIQHNSVSVGVFFKILWDEGEVKEVSKKAEKRIAVESTMRPLEETEERFSIDL